MRAFVYERYGPPEVLELKEVPTPVPRDDELLIRTHATTVTSADRRARSLDVPAGFRLLSRLFFGLRRPRQRILGTELAGRVAAVGRSVTRFKAGDRVFALSAARMGCHAEYVCMPEDGTLALTPANLACAEAAALSFGGTTALHFLRRARLRRDERVLVNGASGGVGTAAVQLARHFGAEVTAVCSAANAALARSLGAGRVLDYAREDFAAGGERYDVIVDTVGTAPFARSCGSLNEGGRLLLVFGTLSDMLLVTSLSLTTGRRVIAWPARGRPEDLRFLARAAASGEFKPVIDRRYPFADMREAHRYVDRGRKKGNVVVTLTADA
jgi:NADPH:quinone reductase-like Zn-dependent oxidoreductase